MSLSEATEVVTQLIRRDAAASPVWLTRREVEAISRLLTDATITLNQISQGVLRREGRNR